jgi:acid phosphatase type 7
MANGIASTLQWPFPMRLLSLLLLMAAALPAADKIVGGPYVVMPAARSATIGWVVETDAVTVSTGGTADKPGRRVPVLRSQKVSLTGLKAGETVQYEIPGPGPVEERRGSFKVPQASPFATASPTGPGGTATTTAAPPAPLVPYDYVVFGDTRTRHDMHRRIVQAIAKSNPDFVLHTGDLVTDGYDTEQWPVFFDIERDLLRKTVYFPVLGNHERDNARFYDFFDVKLPYSSFNWGNTHFSLLDSDVANVSVNPAERDRFWEAQVRWLEDDLQKNQKADFRIVVMHHPPLTANPDVPHMSKLTPALMPMFEKYKVTVAFGGHDHNYQHHVKNGVHYVVTGGGGAPLASVEAPIPGVTLKVEKVEHFVTVHVDGKRMSIHANALDGHRIDMIDIGQ